MCSFLEKVFPIVWARGVTDTRISYTSGQPGVSITARSSAKRQSPEHVTLRRQFFLQFTFSPSLALRKELLSQLTHRGPFTVPFFLLWGKSPETQSM